jgi:hypothetical protein
MKEYRSDGLSSSQCHCELVFFLGILGKMKNWPPRFFLG